MFLVLEHEFLQLRRHRWFRHVFVDGELVFGFADALQSPQPEQRFTVVVGDQLVDTAFALGDFRPVHNGLRRRFVVTFQRLRTEQRLSSAVIGDRRGGGVRIGDGDLTGIVG